MLAVALEPMRRRVDGAAKPVVVTEGGSVEKTVGDTVSGAKAMDATGSDGDMASMGLCMDGP